MLSQIPRTNQTINNFYKIMQYLKYENIKLLQNKLHHFSLGTYFFLLSFKNLVGVEMSCRRGLTSL